VPPTLLFLPLTSVVNWLGLSDSLWAPRQTYPIFRAVLHLAAMG
jgi:hypothetical protein